MAAVIVAAALFVLLGGAARSWLSPAAPLALLVILILASHALARQPAGLRGHASDWRDWLRRHRFAIGLTGVMALTLAIRLPHLSGDLGHAPIDIDENRLATNVREFFITGQIGYETVEHYPGVVFWMLTGASLLAFLRALLDGAIHSVDGMSVEMFTATGRLVNVWVAVGIVAFTAMLGRRLAGEAAGLIAALVVATARMSVDTTTVLRNDPGQVLFLVIAVYAALVLSRSDRWTLALTAGALAGVATGIKYTSVLALAPVLLAVTLNRTWSFRLSRGSVALLGFAVAAAATNHFVWADFPNLLRQLSDQVLVSRGGLSPNPADLHLDHLITFGPGWPLLLLAAGYGAWGLGTGRSEAWVFWSFPLLYSWFTTHSLTQFLRWVFPLLPFVSVAGAAGLTSVVATIIAWRGWPRWDQAWAIRPTFVALVLIGALVKPIWDGVVSFSRRLATPTHELVEIWINEHAAGATVLTGDGHLVFDETNVVTRRVPLVRQTLGGGLYSRLVTDWVVVPEFDKSVAERLRGLFLEYRIVSGQGFGGNTGLDYDIYSTAKLPRSDRGEDILLTDEAAALMLGHEWDPWERHAPGVLLPPGGAGLFLTPLSWSDVHLEFELDEAHGDDPPPFVLAVDDRPVALTIAGDRAKGRRLVGVAHLADPSRITPLRLTPRQDVGEIRLVRFAFRQATP